MGYGNGCVLEKRGSPGEEVCRWAVVKGGRYVVCAGGLAGRW